MIDKIKRWLKHRSYSNRIEITFCPHCGFDIFVTASFFPDNYNLYVCLYCRALVEIMGNGKVMLKNSDAGMVFHEAEGIPVIFYGTDGSETTMPPKEELMAFLMKNNGRK